MEKLSKESFVVEYIKTIRSKDPGIGGGKIWSMYNSFFGKDNSVGYNKFYDIIDKFNLKIRNCKKRTYTTNSKHNLPLYPNLIKNLIPNSPMLLWVSDITYIPIIINDLNDTYKFCYLSLITDYYSKEIVGYCVGESLETKYSLKALEMALGTLKNKNLSTLIHHSDRGVQYASLSYTNKLKSLNIKISMTESGNPKDNAVAERVNNTIKNELLMGIKLYNIEQVEKAVSLAIEFYNNERPHMSLNGMTPKQASMCKGEINKKWISYRENALKNNCA